MPQVFFDITSNLVALLFGALLAQIAQWYKSRNDRNKIRKQVLFYMLEFRAIIPKLNFEPILKKYSQAILKKFPKEYQSEEMEDYLLNSLSPYIDTLIKQILL